MKSTRILLFALSLVVASGMPVHAQVIVQSIDTTVLTLPHPLEPDSGSFCTWGGCSISPRLYHEPLADGRTLVGWTDSSDDGHVSVVSASTIQATHDYPGTAVRGLVAHADGSYALLLYDETAHQIWLSRRTSSGGETWTTSLNGAQTEPDLWVGDCRLDHGGGQYGAYFTVYGIAGLYTGHHGDQLSFVSDSGAVQGGGWEWGCSHSMAELIGYHPGLADHYAVCSSDCYLSKGLNADYIYQLVSSDGDCGGKVSLQLGQMVAVPGAWKVVFNAQDAACCDGYGIGIATFDSSYATSVVWLTNTDGTQERDPVMARIGTELDSDRFLVGWRTTGDGAFRLAIIDGSGAFLEGPEVVSTSGISWGNRDDSMRTRPDGSVSWVQGDASSSTMRLFIFNEGTLFSDGFESGDTSAWSATLL